jgi:hypothetical protein
MKILLWLAVLGLGCIPKTAHRPASAAAPCVTKGEALAFLKSITGELLADSAWIAQTGWRASLKEIEVIGASAICLHAVEELTGWGRPTRPDSVAVLRAGNRYTSVRVDDLNVIMLLDERGHQVRAAVLE